MSCKELSLKGSWTLRNANFASLGLGVAIDGLFQSHMSWHLGEGMGRASNREVSCSKFFIHLRMLGLGHVFNISSLSSLVCQCIEIRCDCKTARAERLQEQKGTIPNFWNAQL